MNKFHVTLSNDESTIIKKSALLSEDNGRIFQSVTAKHLLTDLENSYGSTKFGSDDKQTELELEILTSAQAFIKDQKIGKAVPIFAHIPPKPFHDKNIFIFESMDLLLKHLIEFHFNDEIKSHFALEHYSSYVEIKPFNVTMQNENDDHFIEIPLVDLVISSDLPTWNEFGQIEIDNIPVSADQLTAIFKILKKIYDLEAFFIYLTHFDLSPADLLDENKNTLQKFRNIFIMQSDNLIHVADKYLDVNTEIVTLDEQFMSFIDLSKWFEQYPLQDNLVLCFNNHFFFLHEKTS